MRGWLFVMHGGIEPGDAIGPWETEEEMEAMIVQEMRDNSDLLDDDGVDSIHPIRFDETGKPLIGSFSGGYMDELRKKAWELIAEEDPCESQS